VFLNDRFGAVHLLKPVLDRDSSSFFTNGNDVQSQRSWARARGVSSKTTLEQILLAQIEDHCTEVFYNLDPITYPNSFVRKLPGCVRKTVAWRAAPSTHHDFNEYGVVVNNFPKILKSLEDKGCRTAYFFPAYDPVMSEYCNRRERLIDVLFVGSYSRHHSKRSLLLERIASLSGKHKIAFYLDKSRIVKLSETPLGLFGPLAKYKIPEAVRRLNNPSVFGRSLYETMSNAKIILNVAVDMAGDERGNMRCWEAMGCGAAMLSDEGIYPKGMVPKEHFLTYSSVDEASQQIEDALVEGRWEAIAKHGHDMISTSYSKELQWEAFKNIVG
jgi:hypothetical protein